MALRQSGKPKSARVGIYLVLIVISMVWTFPSAGLLVSSFRSRLAINSSGWWTLFRHPFEFAQQFTLDNYLTVLTRAGMGDAFLNSLTVAIPATVIPLLMASFAAYGFAWLDFFGRKILFALIVSLLVLPVQMALIPVLQVYTSWGVNGTHLAVWFAHTGFAMPLSNICFTTLSAAFPEKSSNPSRSTVPLTFRSFSGSFCPYRCLQSPHSPFFSFFGYGTTFWLLWSFWEAPPTWRS